MEPGELTTRFIREAAAAMATDDWRVSNEAQQIIGAITDFDGLLSLDETERMRREVVAYEATAPLLDDSRPHVIHNALMVTSVLAFDDTAIRETWLRRAETLETHDHDWVAWQAQQLVGYMKNSGNLPTPPENRPPWA